MQLSRGLSTINSSQADTIALATCVSLGGTVFLVLAIYVITKYRLRRELSIAQDALPRPFEITVPTATITNTWTRTRNLVSVPMPTVSPRHYPRNGRRDQSETRRAGASARLVPLRAGSTSTSAMITPSQSQPSSSLNTRIPPYLSKTSPLSNGAAPSSVRFPPHSQQSHLHTPISPDLRTHSGSGAQSGQSSSSLHIAAQFQGAPGVSPSPSTSVRERRSAESALLRSRSASELYYTSASAPHHRLPEGAPSGRYSPPLGRGSEPHVDTFVRPTSHLRHCGSASPVVRVECARLDSEEDMGGMAVFQHQGAGVMQELPPPYHKAILPS